MEYVGVSFQLLNLICISAFTWYQTPILVMHDNTSTSAIVSTTNAASSPPSNPLQHAHHFISIKFTPKIYLFWKTQLPPYLRGQNLQGYIDGTKPCPPSLIQIVGSENFQSNPLHTLWVQQDQLIMSLLISSLFEETIPIVIVLTSSKDILDALEAALSPPSNTRILNIHMQLQNLKQAVSQSPDISKRPNFYLMN